MAKSKQTAKRLEDWIKVVGYAIEQVEGEIKRSKSQFGKLDLTVHLRKLELELAEVKLAHFEAVQGESVACTYVTQN